jgi:hypothetical protein
VFQRDHPRAIDKNKRRWERPALAIDLMLARILLAVNQRADCL